MQAIKTQKLLEVLIILNVHRARPKFRNLEIQIWSKLARQIHAVIRFAPNLSLHLFAKEDGSALDSVIWSVWT